MILIWCLLASQPGLFLTSIESSWLWPIDNYYNNLMPLAPKQFCLSEMHLMKLSNYIVSMSSLQKSSVKAFLARFIDFNPSFWILMCSEFLRPSLQDIVSFISNCSLIIEQTVRPWVEFRLLNWKSRYSKHCVFLSPTERSSKWSLSAKLQF